MESKHARSAGAAVILRGLTKYFDRDGLRVAGTVEANLSVAPGEVLVLVGRNGSGKTTLLDLISGDLRPDQGSVLLLGRDVTRTPAFRRAWMISRVFQQLEEGTFSHLTVQENLLLARSQASPRSSLGQRSKNTDLPPDLLGLAPWVDQRRDQPVHSLSGGERQLLAVLMQFVVFKPLILLDEYTQSLDFRVEETIKAFVESWIRGRDCSTIMVTHDLDYAARIGSRVVVMREGRLTDEFSVTTGSTVDVEAIRRALHSGALRAFERANGEV